jgi:2-aminoethylphosphonate-pyruvate transaminase
MLLLIPGPVQTRPELRAVMGQDIAPWDNDFRAVYAGIRDRIRDLAGGTAETHATLPLQGCGHFMVEAAIRTFTAPGARILIPMNGAYAGRLQRLALEAGRTPVPLTIPDTRPVTADEVAAALAADPDITHVAMVQSETGSGIVNDPAAIGAAVRNAGRRMILDAVSAFGALPLDLGSQPEIDAMVFTSGKCFEGMPGIGFAVARIDRTVAAAGNAGSWAFDLSDVYVHALRAGWGSFRFTPAVQALNAFATALDLHAAEGGQPARLARYQENAKLLYDGALSLGLTPYLERQHQGPIIVTIHQPPDRAFDLQSFVDALKSRGVLISNFHNTQAPTMRIGAIGAITANDIRFAIDAMGATLDAMGIARRDAA